MYKFHASTTQHGFIYLDNGDLYGFGLNENCQLGIKEPSGDTQIGGISQVDFQLILNDPDITGILCYSNVSYLMKADGQILKSGGYKHSKYRLSTFTPIIKDPTIVHIVAGRNYDLFLHTNGQVSILSKWEEQLLYSQQAYNDAHKITRSISDSSDLESICTSLYLLKIINKELLDRYYSTNYPIDGLSNIKHIFNGFSNTETTLAWSDRQELFIFGLIDDKYPKFVEKLSQTQPQRLISGRTGDSKYILPVCVAHIPELKSIFQYDIYLILWLSFNEPRGSYSKLEMVTGYADFNFETRRQIYSAPNIHQVISNKNIILIFLDDGQIDCLRINNVFGLSTQIDCLKETSNIHHIYLGYDWLLFGRETVVENEFMQVVEFYTESTLLANHASHVGQSLLYSIIDVASQIVKEEPGIGSFFPVIYEDKHLIKLFGSGSLTRNNFSPIYFRYLPHIYRKYVSLALYVFRNTQPFIPKFVKYLIFNFLW